jgi:hypothetical protein
MVLAPQTIEQCVSTMKAGSSIALHIDEIILGVGFLAKIRRLERSFYSGTVIDGARFFERSVFCSIGGFDESLPPGPEDWDLDKRLKIIGKIALLNNHAGPISWEMDSFVEKRGILFNPKYVGVYHNESEQSLSSYLKKKQYYSPSMTQYTLKWTSADSDIRKQLGLKYRYLTVFTENKKWKLIARDPLLFVALLGLRGIVGLGYLLNRGIRKKSNIPISE